jgi:hypothetical protein
MDKWLKNFLTMPRYGGVKMKIKETKDHFLSECNKYATKFPLGKIVESK